MPKLSLVIPAHNEAGALPLLLQKVSEVIDAIALQPVFIIVDDGSTDDTWRVVTDLAAAGTYDITGIKLSRNFGKEHAIKAGLSEVSTDSAVVIDADLQHPPELIPKLVAVQQQTQCDVVHGVKTSRANESAKLSPTTYLFYYLYKACVGVPIQGASDYKLLTQRVIREYTNLREQELFFRGVIPWLGFSQESVPYVPNPRLTGHTKWNFTKRLKIGWKALTSFSTAPLHLVTIMGALFLVGATVLSLHTLYNWYQGVAVAGFTTVIIILLTLGSGMMIGLGILGQYIAHLYNEVRRRPTHIIQDTVKSSYARSAEK